MSVKRKLYDLAGADEGLRFSPYCWRVKLALAHKNLAFETVAWRFTDKDAIAFSGQGRVPVLVDGKRVVCDSWAIAEYLETAYPNEPSLFGDLSQRALTRFVKDWAEGALHLALGRLVLPDIHDRLHEKDRAYFRESRETMYGETLEAIRGKREGYVPVFESVLGVLRRTLGGQAFLCGEAPLFADHVVFGALMWGSTVSSVPLWREDDVVAGWMGRVLGAYGLDG